MITVLDAPRIQAAPDVVEHAIRCGEEGTDEDKEYLFYEGDSIVFRVSADCYVCAWKDGHPRFSRAQMAVALELDPNDMSRGECRCEIRQHLGDYIFFEGDSIVGRLRDYCAMRAWKKGHPQWALADLAVNIPMGPADVYLNCQG